jgi:hypothetical protein
LAKMALLKRRAGFPQAHWRTWYNSTLLLS